MNYAKVSVVLTVDYFVPNDPRELTALRDVIAAAWRQHRDKLRHLVVSVPTAAAVLANGGRVPHGDSIRPALVNFKSDARPATYEEYLIASRSVEEIIKVTDDGTEIFPQPIGHA